jgi:hypothetical protein
MVYTQLNITDKENTIINNHLPISNNNEHVDYNNCVCIKPWGYEFLVYENDKIGIEELENEQDKILEEIIAFRNQYLEIDKEFNTEINDNINLSLKSFSIMNWFKS